MYNLTLPSIAHAAQTLDNNNNNNYNSVKMEPTPESSPDIVPALLTEKISYLERTLDDPSAAAVPTDLHDSYRTLIIPELQLAKDALGYYQEGDPKQKPSAKKWVSGQATAALHLSNKMRELGHTDQRDKYLKQFVELVHAERKLN